LTGAEEKIESAFLKAYVVEIVTEKRRGKKKKKGTAAPNHDLYSSKKSDAIAIDYPKGEGGGGI